MIDLATIIAEYPSVERPLRRNILREYLQYRILQSIFNSPYASKLSFLGGTALRIVYGMRRFSEDLDFDNFKLDQKEFTALSTGIKRDLEREGYTVELTIAFKGAYRCCVRMHRLLFEQGLSPHENENMMIQIDTVPQHFSYTPDKKILNRFDIFTQIFVTPLSILLSQKIAAALTRKTPKGRDFYDVTVLFGKTKPDYRYLHEKINIASFEELKKRILVRCAHINFSTLGKDVQAFLVDPADVKKVILFKEYIKGMSEE